MFKIFGIQRSGTTYLRELLKINFNAIVLTHELGWKHGIIGDPYVHFLNNKHLYDDALCEDIERHLEEKSITAIIAVKHPYTWVPSIYRWKPQDIINDTKHFVEAAERWGDF